MHVGAVISTCGWAVYDEADAAILRAFCCVLVAGVAATLLALTVRSAAMFFAGAAVSGVGFGSGFQGGIRTEIPPMAAHERAGVLSLLFVVSYPGLEVPAVAAGFLAGHGPGLIGAARYYGAALIVLAVLALRPRPRPKTPSAPG